ncbi:MAG TPA: LamG-like jellyroll fold domain-containing protein [Polyangia bacterium]|jgi:hypothetical protein
MAAGRRRFGFSKDEALTTGTTFALGLVTLILGACSSGSAGGGSGGSVAGSGGAGGSGSGGVVGTGSGGSNATGSGGSGSGGAVATTGSGGAAVDAPIDVPPEVATTPCPGAGKSLHFADDLGGTKTMSMQVLADLGSDLPKGDDARTIEFWAYFEGAESWKAEHSIVEYGGTGRCQAFGIDGGDNGAKDPIQFDPFTFSAGGTCKGDDNNSIMPQPPRTGWLHLAWVYDPTGTLSYSGMTSLNFMFTVNGVAQNIPDKKQMGALVSMATTVSIGSGQTTNDGFTGKIDEFRMWNVARTEQEIADNYKLILKGDEAGLVAYYHFDDGTGTAPKDSSSKHHDAMFATGHPAPTWVESTELTLTCK